MLKLFFETGMESNEVGTPADSKDVLGLSTLHKIAIQDHEKIWHK